MEGLGRISIRDRVPVPDACLEDMRKPRRLLELPKRPPEFFITEVTFSYRPIRRQRQKQLAITVPPTASHRAITHASGDRHMVWPLGGRWNNVQINMHILRHDLVKNFRDIPPPAIDMIAKDREVARRFVSQSGIPSRIIVALRHTQFYRAARRSAQP